MSKAIASGVSTIPGIKVTTLPGVSLSNPSQEWTNYEILVGKHKLSSDPTGIAKHWAIGIVYVDDGTTEWYEIEGASLAQSGKPNKVMPVHNNSDKYTEKDNHGRHAFRGSKEQFKAWLDNWHAKWVKNHPFYHLNGDNCQRHVQDFLRLFEKKVKTQNSDIAAKAIGFGIGGMVFCAFIIGIGVLIQGDHP